MLFRNLNFILVCSFRKTVKTAWLVPSICNSYPSHNFYIIINRWKRWEIYFIWSSCCSISKVWWLFSMLSLYSISFWRVTLTSPKSFCNCSISSVNLRRSCLKLSLLKSHDEAQESIRQRPRYLPNHLSITTISAEPIPFRDSYHTMKQIQSLTSGWHV